MKRLPTPVATIGFLVAAALATVGGLAIAAPASALMLPDPDGILSISVSAVPLWESDIQPGETRYWLIDTELDSTEPGELTLVLDADGELAAHPQGLHMSFDRCSEPWTAATTPTCAGTASTVMDGALATINESHVHDLGVIRPHDGPYFLATLSLPAVTPNDLQDTEGTIGFGFTAAEDTSVVIIDGIGGGGSGGGGLVRTGVDLAGPLMLAGGLILGGFILARQRAGEPRSMPAPKAVLA